MFFVGVVALYVHMDQSRFVNSPAIPLERATEALAEINEERDLNEMNLDATRTSIGDRVPSQMQKELPAREHEAEDAGCTITIVNPLADFRVEPRPFARQLGRLMRGDYVVLESRIETFGPKQGMWYRIEYEGRMGWVEDSIISIGGKSAGCP